jgi:hypothetical protein
MVTYAPAFQEVGTSAHGAFEFELKVVRRELRHRRQLGNVLHFALSCTRRRQSHQCRKHAVKKSVALEMDIAKGGAALERPVQSTSCLQMTLGR